MTSPETKTTGRIRARALYAIAAAAALALAPVTPAFAADTTVQVGTPDALVAALSDCAGTVESPQTIELTADIPMASVRLTVPCHLVLDLADFRLDTAGVVITSGRALTIDDSAGGGELFAGASYFEDAGIQNTGATLIIKGGAVTAAGGGSGAGIGGGNNGTGGTTMITGGTVTAAGGGWGAGIGGGDYGTGGTTMITGGTVTATGGVDSQGSFGAGIGGGRAGSGGTTTITGGTVVASAYTDGLDSQGAGIGGGGQDYGVAGFGRGGGTITISGGDVTAKGGSFGAGIGGGGPYASGDTITITSGTVTAQGGAGAAGIGGGGNGSGGTIAIGGGTVTATGGNLAAGIGGGHRGPGGTITISGGDVTASGVGSAAGIGGGWLAPGGTVTIGEAAIVTASGAATAVGGGTGSTDFGSLNLAGTLHVPTGALVVPDSTSDAPEVVIAETGKLLGTVDDPTTGAQLAGDGQIANGGVIALDATLVGVTVTDNNYAVGFQPQAAATETVRVFGPRFDGSYRSVPAAGTHRGWNTSADGTGTWFTSTTALTGDLTVYETTRVGVTLTPEDSTTDAGVAVTFTATVTDHETGEAVDDALVTLASSVDSDEIAGLRVTATEPGERTITATVTGTTATGTATLTVRDPAPTGCNLGTPGTLVAPWSAQTVYQAGQLAALDGVVYKAAWYAHRDVPGASPWGPWEFHTVCGVSPETVQAWSKTTVYDTGDQVTHNGKTWRAKWWTRNQAPGDPWGPWETVG